MPETTPAKVDIAALQREKAHALRLKKLSRNPHIAAALKERDTLKKDRAASSEKLRSLADELTLATAKIQSLEAALASLKDQNAALTADLAAAKAAAPASTKKSTK